MSSRSNSAPRSARERVIAELEDLAGPLGPFGSIERRETHKEQLVEAAPDWLLDGLLDVLVEPPAGGWRWDDVELAIVELLAGIAGQRDIGGRLRPLLENPSARPVVIDVLGAIGDRRAVGWLEHAYDDDGALTEDELVRLADALGDLGGDEALSLLRRMADRDGLPARAQREIDLARERVNQ